MHKKAKYKVAKTLKEKVMFFIDKGTELVLLAILWFLYVIFKICTIKHKNKTSEMS